MEKFYGRAFQSCPYVFLGLQDTTLELALGLDVLTLCPQARTRLSVESSSEFSHSQARDPSVTIVVKLLLCSTVLLSTALCHHCGEVTAL